MTGTRTIEIDKGEKEGKRERAEKLKKEIMITGTRYSEKPQQKFRQ